MEGAVCSVALCFALFCLVIFYYIIYLIYYYLILLLSPLFHLRSFLFFWVQKSSCLEDKQQVPFREDCKRRANETGHTQS